MRGCIVKQALTAWVDQVDIEKDRRLLGWVPPISVDEGLWRAVDG
ncbi:hypothetical protein [Rhodoferax sp.]|nr:hypothetical protein [Rhodoferax sp.]